MTPACVCGDLFCDGYNSACWDAEVRRGQAEAARRFGERYRKMQAVIEAARTWVEWVDGDGDWEVDPELTLLDAVRALDGGAE